MRIFSTATAAPRERFDLWRSAITRQFVPLRPERVDDQPFWGEVDSSTVESLTLSHIDASGQIVHRSRREIAESTADVYFLNLQVRGTSGFCQGAAVQRLAPGELFVVDASQPFRLHCERSLHHLCVTVPAHALRPHLLRPRLAAGTLLRRLDGAENLLADYLLAVAAEADALDALAGGHVAQHIIDLCAHALNRVHAPVPLPRAAARAALYRRACSFVERHFGDPTLSPADIARHLRTSLRFVHGLFREHDESPMRFIVKQRVEAARRVLADPAHRHRTITEIAFACGFSDLAHFSRTIALQTGLSPRELRRKHLVS